MAESGRTYNASVTGGKFMRSDAFFRAIMGPIGSGKSVTCVIEIIRRCKQQKVGPDGFRRSRWVVVRNTAAQLKDTTFKTWCDWVPVGVAGRWKESDKTFFLEFGDVRAEILFRPLDSAEDVQRVLSLELTGAWINEAREIPKEIVDALMGRLRRYPSAANGGFSWSGLIADTNPPEIDSYWFKVFEGIPIDEDDENSIVICDAHKQPSGLSPDAENTENLHPDYYTDLSKGKIKEWVDTYVHGMYSPSLSGTPVYRKSFRMEKHISPVTLEVNGALPVIIGMDFGRTPAAVLKQMTPDGRIRTLAESVAFGMGLENFITRQLRPLLRNRCPGLPYVIIGDPSGVAKDDTGELNCFKVLKRFFPRDEGHVVKPAQTNDPDTRIRATESTFLAYPDGEPLHLIDPSCRWLIEAYRSKYRYQNQKTKEMGHRDKPDKNNWSHVAEAGQYGDLFLMGGKYHPADYIIVEHNGGFNPLMTRLPERRQVPIAGY
jgi:hypothetical protein